MMKIVDIDCIANPFEAALVNSWVREHMYRDKEGVIRKRGPIKYLSTRIKDIGKFKDYAFMELCLIPVGDLVRAGSVAEYLSWMVNALDSHAAKHGMSVTGRFRCKNGTHQVMTNREFADIERLGAMPVPSWLLGLSGAKHGDV